VFNALSLSPALAAMLLRPKDKTKPRGLLGRFYDGFNHRFDQAQHGYLKVAGTLLRKMTFTAILLAVILGVALTLGARLPTAFIPVEDQGYAFVAAQLPYASSLERTDAVCKQIEKIIQSTPGVKYCTTVEGFSLLSQVQATYNAFFFVTLKPWAERHKADEQIGAIQAHLNAVLAKMPEAQVVAFSPPSIPGVGTAGGFTFILEDRSGSQDPSFLTQNVDKFMAAARTNKVISGLITTHLPSVPQVYVNVDRDKVLKLGCSLNDVYTTMQTFMGGNFVNYFNRFGRLWQVYLEAEDVYRTRAENLLNFYVRNNQGQPVPLSAFTRIQYRTGPEFVMHYNEYPCAQINGQAAKGYSDGQVTEALEEVFAQTMPPGMGRDYFGMSFQERQAAQGVSPLLIFSLSVLCVFLILAAQFESWSLPMSVLLGTPTAIFGAFFALTLRGVQNNVYVQIGLIMLIGLAAKNAILIIAFAKMEYEKGKSYSDAALTGARIRLRPILMTSFAFICGCLPLWFATGSGGVSRRVLGTVVIGGMLGATFVDIFIVPVTFAMVERVIARSSKKTREAHEHPAPEPNG
jgi:HAE1 family hydrophobic/amphiphilic exporter-1